MAIPPAVNRRIIETLLEDELSRVPQRRLVLVHGRYEDSTPAEFCTDVAGVPRRIRVVDQSSVLGIIEAWQEHQAATVGSDDVLVVTTGVGDAQLGWDLRGHALYGSTRTVDRSKIVAHRFGAVEIDPRIRREGWLVDALLDAEPPSGWPRCGSLLTRDFAVRALIEVRLGGQLGDAAVLSAGALDSDALLAWSLTSAGPARFAALSDTERVGVTEWLTETVGDVAPVLLGLVAAGRRADAIALGVLGSVLTSPGVSAEAALAFGGLFDDLRFRPAELRLFTEAVERVLERWCTEAESNATSNGARQRVLDVVERADELATAAALTEVLAANRFLPLGFQARLRAVAGTLSAHPPAAAAAAVVAAESALCGLREHRLEALYPRRVRAAQMAVRLLRWLATPESAVASVAAGVRDHLGEWGWVDRALAVVWAGDSVSDPVVGQGYRTVYEQARARRDALDEAFARRLVTWTEHADTQAPGDCLLVEDVLERAALPLAAGVRAPLILVLDAMSGAIATELGEQLTRRSWIEIAPDPGRRMAAVSALPSVTRVSRASLLTGRLTTGDQASEKEGFTAFWRKHRRGAVLFHKAEIGGYAGHRLAEPLVEALAGDGVVGVVLNTIDDALQHGREGDRIEWELADITYLPELLNTARSYGRPVMLVADHGHVLDRAVPDPGLLTAPAESARWRTGVPEPGEVALTGPRVLYGDGHIVAPWRENIRYTHRRSGYHGGASPAEMTVPILILLPSPDLLPSRWSVLPPESTRPAWWEPRRTSEPAQSGGVAAPVKPVKRKGKAVAEHGGVDGLFAVEDVPVAPSPATAETVDRSATWGARVVATEVYASQRAFVRKAPDKAVVAGVIDALIAADGTLSLTAVAAAAAGRAGRNPDGLAATLQRLLNVEGYPVLGLADGGRTLKLDQELLRQQFGLDSP